MKLKLYAAAAAALMLASIPQNGIGCGPDEDPHDYFSSFFSRSAGSEAIDRPFYYTSLEHFYDDWETTDTTQNTAALQEWMKYAGVRSGQQAADLVYRAPQNEVARLSEQISSGRSLSGAYASNELAQALSRQKNKAAISYLLFAKKTEVFSAPSDWDATPKRDSLSMNRYIAQANELFNSTGDAFLKSRYAFQRCKLAFYNNRFKDCIAWHDAYFEGHPEAATAPAALSYKAGSFYHLGRSKDAAYNFSKAFTATTEGRRNTYQGFLWATNDADPKLENEYTAQAGSKKEKAALLGMFGLYGTSYRISTVQKLYELDASSPLLPLLVNREINKLEEQYLTPLLVSEKGGIQHYISFSEAKAPQAKDREQLAATTQLLEKMAGDQSLARRGFYAVAAAYLNFMKKDWGHAENMLAIARQTRNDERVNDQLRMIELLVLTHKEKNVSAATLAQALPGVKWLEEKGKTNEEYRSFYRNFFSELMAQRYRQLNDAPREALSYGVADMGIKYDGSDIYAPYTAIDHLRDEMSSAELASFYQLLTSTTTDAWDKYLIGHSSIGKNDVIDVLATSYLRDRDYTQAIAWLKKADKLLPITETRWDEKSGNDKTINVDPLYDYLNDWQRLDKHLAKPYTKLLLAQKLMDLQASIDTSKNASAKSKLCYQYASALYNMSYYGNSWQAVNYNRSGADWNMGNYKLPWQKEYYGVLKVRELYQQAYDLATDREFKAACLFMVAKCAQRQIPQPEYDYNNTEKWERMDSTYRVRFRNNALFPKFIKEFGNTRFYSYVYNRCSYLRDFARKKH